jgi:hypothetical protein
VFFKRTLIFKRTLRRLDEKRCGNAARQIIANATSAKTPAQIMAAISISS